jgi:hypothetical protein
LRKITNFSGNKRKVSSTVKEHEHVWGGGTPGGGGGKGKNLHTKIIIIIIRKITLISLPSFLHMLWGSLFLTLCEHSPDATGHGACGTEQSTKKQKPHKDIPRKISYLSSVMYKILCRLSAIC